MTSPFNSAYPWTGDDDRDLGHTLPERETPERELTPAESAAALNRWLALWPARKRANREAIDKAQKEMKP